MTDSPGRPVSSPVDMWSPAAAAPRSPTRPSRGTKRVGNPESGYNPLLSAFVDPRLEEQQKRLESQREERMQKARESRMQQQKRVETFNSDLLKHDSKARLETLGGAQTHAITRNKERMRFDPVRQQYAEKEVQQDFIEREKYKREQVVSERMKRERKFDIISAAPASGGKETPRLSASKRLYSASSNNSPSISRIFSAEEVTVDPSLDIIPRGRSPGKADRGNTRNLLRQDPAATGSRVFNIDRDDVSLASSRFSAASEVGTPPRHAKRMVPGARRADHNILQHQDASRPLFGDDRGRVELDSSTRPHKNRSGVGFDIITGD